VGRADLIARIRKNPLLRTFRVDKLTYAALEATLFEYVTHSTIPLMRMLNVPPDEIEKRCTGIVDSVWPASVSVTVIPVESVVGGGTAPSVRLKSFAVSVQHSNLGPDELLKKLRASDPPVIGRIAENKVVLDLRTVPPQSDETILRALGRL
jgi:L-seryl-tRNA(Ser) seleniumtransferase